MTTKAEREAAEHVSDCVVEALKEIREKGERDQRRKVPRMELPLVAPRRGSHRSFAEPPTPMANVLYDHIEGVGMGGFGMDPDSITVHFTLGPLTQVMLSIADGQELATALQHYVDTARATKERWLEVMKEGTDD